MEEVCGGNKGYIHDSTFEREHSKSKELAIQTFENKPKMGGNTFSSTEQVVVITTGDAKGQKKTYLEKVSHFFFFGIIFFYILSKNLSF